MKTALTHSLDNASRHMDRLMGHKAKHYHNPSWTLDVTTGQQSLSGTPKNVVVRAWPINYSERKAISDAGITEVDTRWTMRVKYGEAIPGDLFVVGGFSYTVVDSGVTIDEHYVDQVILTKRRR